MSIEKNEEIPNDTDNFTDSARGYEDVGEVRAYLLREADGFKGARSDTSEDVSNRLRKLRESAEKKLSERDMETLKIDLQSELLRQAQLGREERNPNFTVDRLYAIFGEGDARLGENLYILYGILHHKAGFSLSGGRYAPKSTITNIAHIWQRFHDWKKEGGSLGKPDADDRINKAFGNVTRFLSNAGWPELRQNIILELATDREQEFLASELEHFGAKENADSVLEQAREGRARAGELLASTLLSDDPYSARRDLLSVKRLISYSRGLEKYAGSLKDSGAAERPKEISMDNIKALVLLNKATALHASAQVMEETVKEAESSGAERQYVSKMRGDILKVREAAAYYEKRAREFLGEESQLSGNEAKV